ncbi:hypothetical protein PM082_023712 [Marasmius tenuissimus]|nr:hypothetical protein PM082_023712 [Marasmius tenuissimus]
MITEMNACAVMGGGKIEVLREIETNSGKHCCSGTLTITGFIRSGLLLRQRSWITSFLFNSMSMDTADGHQSLNCRMLTVHRD